MPSENPTVAPNETVFCTLQTRLRLKHIPALDGMRTLAVFAVIFYHFGFEKSPGGHGVMLFFVLSGFLITWLLLGENDRTGTVSLRAFYARRALRIFPAFYTYWFVILVLLLVTNKLVPWGNAVASFFFVSNYYIGLNHHSANAFSHTWSLSIEEQFYLLWPAMFLFLRNNLARLMRVLVALIVVTWLFRIVLCIGFGASSSYIYAAFETRCDHFLVGCLTAVLLRRGACRSLWEKATSHAVMPFLTLGVLFCSIYFGGPLVQGYREVIGFALDPLLFALLLIQWVALSDHPLWSWLNSRPMRYLGRISYPLYLYQQVTLYPVRRILHAQPVWLQLGVAVAATVGVASLSYYCIERPFLRWKRRFQTDAPPPLTGAGSF